MHMQVLGESSACGATLIESNIDALRMKRTLNEFDCAIDELPELRSLLRGVVHQSRSSVGEGDENMSIRIGVAIEHDQSMCVSKDDMMGVRVCFIVPCGAQKIRRGRRGPTARVFCL